MSNFYTRLNAFEAEDGQSMRIDLPMPALDQVPLGIGRVDHTGALTYLNRTLLQITGLDHWAGKTVGDLFHGESLERVREGLRQRANMEGGSYEVLLTRSDGRQVPIIITAFPETTGGTVGTLALVRDLTLDKAIEEMIKHVENISSTGELFQAIAAELKPLVDFDELQVVRLNQGRTHLRTIYPDCVVEERSYRWWLIPQAMRHMLERRDPLILNDLAAWYEEQRRGGLAADMAIERFIASGFTASLSLPVFQNGLQVASIVLCRKGGQVFKQEEADIAQKLPLTEAVSVGLRNETEGDLNFLIGLINDIAGAYDSVGNVAKTVVKRIADHYGWDYVSIHRVDKAHQLIRLIAQEARDPELRSDRLTLGIREGIVGEVHRSKQAVRSDDLATDPDFRHIFVPHRGTRTHSELCVPVGPQADWLLNVEDKKTEAFCPEDELSLRKVATSLDALLRRTLDYNYRTALVRSANDAILLVDANNLIQEANEAASRLLREPLSRIEQRPLRDFLDGTEHAQMLLDGDSFPNHGARMRRRTGPEAHEMVQVLLSVARLPEDSPGRVFIASDLSQYVRGDELELARELFREITGQVKTPMSLAISWLRRLAQQQDPPGGASGGDLPEKVLQQLQKAELTLDRMLLIERDGQPAQRLPCLMEIDEVVRQSLADLPERERLAVDQVSDAQKAQVRADAFELRYCVLTVLTYLLRLAVHASRIDLRTSVQGGEVRLVLAGRADAARTADFDARCRGGQAVAELALGRQTLATLAQRNGGRYEEFREGERAVFAFVFPRSTSAEAS